MGTTRHRAATAAVLALLLAPGVALLTGATSRASSGGRLTFVSYNATANAAADHVQVWTSAYPNYTNGIIDNRYPLAHVHVDNSPVAEGTATPLDTGPAGQTAFSLNHQTQPQYADARCCSGASAPASFGTQGGPYAEATANEQSATARATAAGTPSLPVPPGSGPPETPQGFAAALSAWAKEFLTVTVPGLPSALPVPSAIPSLKPIIQSGGLSLLPALPPALPPIAPLPSPPTSPGAGPDGVDGVTAVATATLDPAGRLVVTGDARVARAGFLGGLLVLHGIHSAVTIVNDGTPRPSVTLDIGSVEVGGVAVTIGANGLTVASTSLIHASAAQTASAKLNSLLASAGISVSLLTPTATVKSSQVGVHASGVSVTYTSKRGTSGGAEYVVHELLADVDVESLAIRAAAFPAPIGSGPSGGGQGITTAWSGGAIPAAAAQVPTQPETRTAVPPPSMSVPAAALRSRPLWLLLLYAMWQSAIIGTVASIAWWRMERSAPA